MRALTRIEPEPPPYRPLKAFTFDPSSGHGARSMTIAVPYEPLKPGPVSKLLAVVDYDASNDRYYPPVNLDEPTILLRGGLEPSEADPRFHQQMVYAVVTETINRFKFALGRDPKWHRNLHGRLLVLPHAMQAANAFYSRDLGALAFGYFRASETDPGPNLPGQVVFTCLSHDIIVHEATHALIDGQKAYFLEQTGLDSPAFHEAFADIVALFQHFTYTDALLDVIRRTGGLIHRPDVAPETRPGEDGPLIQVELSTANPLVQLARQFGEALGMRRALRAALGTPPNTQDLDRVFEPHDRGAILVAAVFDAYFSVYIRRTRDLLRIGRASGAASGDDLHPDLAARLASEASKTAAHFSNICIRALDYCPPVDIEFGDFLRALITADRDLVSDDPLGYRSALIDAFRLRGIRPAGVTSYAEDALRWCTPADANGKPLPPCDGLEFDLFGTPTRQEYRHNAKLLHQFGTAHAEDLGLTGGNEKIGVHSFHPIHRVGPDGSLKREVVVELMQQRDEHLVPDDPGSPRFKFRGGTTLVLDHHGRTLYAIPKPIGGRAGEERLKRQRAYFGQIDAALADSSYLDAPAAENRPPRPLSALDSGPRGSRPMRFDLIHRGY